MRRERAAGLTLLYYSPEKQLEEIKSPDSDRNLTYDNIF